jgi:acetolactate synthase-1/2/3 large subunit
VREQGPGPGPAAGVFEHVAGACTAHGVRTVFGVMGDGNLAFIDAMTRRHGARYVAAAREDGAVLMADGWARVTGSTGVCTVTHGPGLTNTVTAIVEAVRSRTPLVLVAADTATGATSHPQWMEQRDLVLATGAAWMPVTSRAGAAADTARAFRTATLEQRPVVLDVAVDSLPEGCPASLPSPWTPPALGPADHQSVAAAVAALAGADRIVVLGGRGAVRAGAAPALTRLADRAGGLLATTLLGKDLFSGHPFDLGICGGYATEVAREELLAADCVLAVGASLNRFTTDGGELLADTTVVQVDTDAAALGRHWPADVALLGDARTVVEELCAALPAGASGRARTDELARRLQRARSTPEHPDASDASGLDLRSVARRMDELVPADRLLVVDGGHASVTEPVRLVRVAHPTDLLFPLAFGSIGLALGTAVGAAVASPGRPVLVFVGDGGLLMSLTELDTAVRERLPLVVVVLHDGAYGYELHNMARIGLPTDLAEFVRPDFAALAVAWGARGVTARTVSDLDALEPLLRDVRGPVLVDAHLTRAVKTDWYTRHEG